MTREDDPAIVAPPLGKFSAAEMAAWGQHCGVRRIMLSSIDYEDQFMIVGSLHAQDARAHFERHGFKYEGRLAFRVPIETAPPWMIRASLWLGRVVYGRR